MRGIFETLWSSLFWKFDNYYPRESVDGIEEQIKTVDVINRIKRGLGNPSKVDGELISRAKESLAEVKAQTEYQDAKAARLLTIVAFLTAAVGVLFGKFVDIYPLHESSGAGWLTAMLVTATYISLGLYLILIAYGAIVTFQATATRFVWNGQKDIAAEQVKSPLFFLPIARTEPESWGRTFASSKDSLNKLYYESLVVET